MRRIRAGLRLSLALAFGVAALVAGSAFIALASARMSGADVRGALVPLALGAVAALGLIGAAARALASARVEVLEIVRGELSLTRSGWRFTGPEGRRYRLERGVRPLDRLRVGPATARLHRSLRLAVGVALDRMDEATDHAARQATLDAFFDVTAAERDLLARASLPSRLRARVVRPFTLLAVVLAVVLVATVTWSGAIGLGLFVVAPTVAGVWWCHVNAAQVHESVGPVRGAVLQGLNGLELGVTIGDSRQLPSSCVTTGALEAGQIARAYYLSDGTLLAVEHVGPPQLDHAWSEPAVSDACRQTLDTFRARFH